MPRYFPFIFGGVLIGVAVLALILMGKNGDFVRSDQIQEKIYRIGIAVRGKSYMPGIEGFKSKMGQLGYKEGKDIIYDTFVVDKREALTTVIAELLAKKVDVIHTYSTPATVEAYNQTKTIPIVFGSMGDPLASGTVQSFERSGTNVTGVTSLSAPLVEKRLELLLEVAPTAKKIAFPLSLDDIPGKSSYELVLKAAEKLQVEIIPYYVTDERPSKETALAILKKDVDGIVLSSDSTTWANLADYISQSLKEKLPFAVFDKDMVVAGGLVGYGPDYFVSGEQSAILVDKILRGQHPSDLPIEVPQKLVLAVNLKTAQAIGIELPETLLQRAEVVVTE